MINVKYRERYKGEYNDIKDSVFRNDFRLNLIKNTIKNLDGNVLILISKIEKEGELLKNYLQNSDINKEVVFIWGDTKTDERDHWRLELEKRKDIALIASFPIFSMGVNIPSLKYILFASPVKSNIRVLQSVGRALRIHTDKTNGAKIFDIVDQVKYLNDHGRKRIKYYVKEGFDIIEDDTKEEWIDIQKGD
jgi:superfamily II DNA or RNA helicase